MVPLRFGGKADAYLEWAALTGFADVDRPDRQVALVRRVSGVVATTTVHEDALDSAIAPPAVERAELAAAVAGAPATPPVALLNLTDSERVVLGVIDDGCPFARAGLLDKEQAPRVRLLWDQHPQPTPDARVGYGRVLTDADLKPKSGSDDLQAYEAQGMTNLRRRATHGAHVLDVLAGPRAARSRVSPSRFALHGGNGSTFLSPPWTPAQDTSSQAPIVFVQLPRTAIDDPTGRWLARHVLDGLDFIVAQAIKARKKPGAPGGVKKLVVSLSWGPQTGPHDGSSLLEQAFEERVRWCQKAKIDLHLVLAAGNSYESRAHAQWPATAGCAELVWQVMPDAGHPQFLEVWWPAGTPMADVDLTVRSPGGAWLRFEGAILPPDGTGALLPADAARSWGITVVPHGQRVMALLALAPTRPSKERTSPLHGRWRIEVKAAPRAPADEPVHVYVARNTANMGGRRRAPDSYLVDPAYEATRHGRWPREEPASSIVRREGTISGIATGPASTSKGDRGVEVVGGYMSARDPKRAAVNPSEREVAARYSASGPSAAAKTGTPRDPDWALPTDESPFLRGVLAGGVREGTAVRLTGTSTAAPQLARKRANGDPVKPLPSFKDPVHRPPPVDEHRGKTTPMNVSPSGA